MGGQVRCGIGSKDGIAIGANDGAGDSFTENHVGGIDAVYAYARAMPGGGICTAAGQDGQDGCHRVSCNQGGPG